jgi:hypothetical protein
MLQLPFCASAEIDIAKLRDYCLSASRHKARMFQAALGLTSENAEWLRQEILAALPHAVAERQESDEYGERWQVEVLLARQNRRSVVKTIWMIRHGSRAPRLVTCWLV